MLSFSFLLQKYMFFVHIYHIDKEACILHNLMAHWCQNGVIGVIIITPKFYILIHEINFKAPKCVFLSQCCNCSWPKNVIIDNILHKPVKLLHGMHSHPLLHTKAIINYWSITSNHSSILQIQWSIANVLSLIRTIFGKEHVKKTKENELISY